MSAKSLTPRFRFDNLVEELELQHYQLSILSPLRSNINFLDIFWHQCDAESVPPNYLGDCVTMINWLSDVPYPELQPLGQVNRPFSVVS
jgi:hypothetical protein